MTAIVMRSSYGRGGPSSAIWTAPRADGWLSALARAPRAIVELLLSWQSRAEQRHRLLALDNHMLKDMGISRAEAEAEGGKPFWRD